MRNFIKSLGLMLALLSQSAYAMPTLFFDGDMTYVASTGGLSVAAVLSATQEIDSAPELMGSSVIFSATLDSVDASSSFITIGSFGGVAGYDITATDGNFDDLLLADFSSLELMGRNGSDFGLITGVMSASDGLLADMFGTGKLFALVFNMSTVFTADMFDSSFDGKIDGRIAGEAQAVPAPGVLALLGLGLVLMGARKIRTC